MSKKITEKEFLYRFYQNFPEAKIKLINYTAISKPLEIECVLCSKHYKAGRARDFLNSFSCCGSNANITKIERLKQKYANSTEFEFIKQTDKDHFIVRHNKCGQEIKRVIGNSLDNPFACRFCGTHKVSQRLDISEVQLCIDERFHGEIQILDYQGQLEKNHYKCLKCGLIFLQQQTCLMQSRGCPKCDKYKSNGEKQVTKFLQKQGAEFQEQVGVAELPLQKFDFCVYENGNIKYFIEVQGEQHREKREIFRESLEKIQERDQRKKDYCRKNNIPLYEIIYQKGKILNLDILPFGSTTISAKESTSQVDGDGKSSYSGES